VFFVVAYVAAWLWFLHFVLGAIIYCFLAAHVT
jgi:hypothetical protein